MVKVMPVYPADHVNVGGGCPQVQVHFEHRYCEGNGIAVVVYGEMKITGGERILAKELGLKTLQVLDLTPELDLNNGVGYMVQKYIHHKGEFDNYASIDIFDDASNWVVGETNQRENTVSGPVDGSIWLDFIALGE